MYVLIYPAKWSPHSYIFFLVMRTFKVYSLSKFEIYYRALLTYLHAVHYIPKTHLSCNCNFIPFDHHCPFYPTPPPIVTTSCLSSPVFWFVLFLSFLSLCWHSHFVLVSFTWIYLTEFYCNSLSFFQKIALNFVSKSIDLHFSRVSY